MINQNISTDVSRANLFNPVIMAEDDIDTRVLVSQILKDGEILPLTDQNVYFNYRMANYIPYPSEQGHGTIEGSISNGKAVFPVPNIVLTLDDMVLCDISIEESIELTIHTPTVVDDQLTATASTVSETQILKTGTFYIDSRYRVMEAL